MNVEKAAILAFRNKKMIEESNQAGCYYCLEIFPTSEVVQFTDNGQTAICPRCGVDAILPSSAGLITADFLKQSKLYWFGDKKCQ